MAHPITEVSNFSYDLLNKELELFLKDRPVHILKAYNGEFWCAPGGDRNNKNTEGTTLLPGSQGGFSGTVDGIFKKRYVYRNVIREVAGRVAGTFFGKAPNWKYQMDGQIVDIEDPVEPKPTEGELPAEQTSIFPTELSSLDKALNDFWTRQNVSTEISKAFESRLVFGRGGLRVFIPTKYKRANAVEKEAQPAEPGAPTESDKSTDEQYVAFKSIEEAIQAMRVEFVDPTQARLLDDGGEYFSIIKYSMRDNWETQKDVNVIEFSFVDNSDQTVIGTVKENESVGSIKRANLSSAFDLAGFPTYYEIKGVPYITDALYRNNQLLNLALTCAGFSLVDNGFGEMILTNVELETEEVEGPDGTKIKKAKNLRRGGGASQNFVGITTYDQEGNETVATPGVTFREPSALTTYKDGSELAYTACLQEAVQVHALISGDATASGESRIQALFDYLLKVSPYKSEVDEIGSWVLTTVLRWAAELALKQIGDAKVVFESRMFITNLTADERNAIMEMRKAGVISRETERIMLGIDDPTIEDEQIQREQSLPPDEIAIEEFSERLDVGLKMLSLSIDTNTIQKFLGYTDEQITEMQRIATEQEAALQAEFEKQQANLDNQNSGQGVGTQP